MPSFPWFECFIVIVKDYRHSFARKCTLSFVILKATFMAGLWHSHWLLAP